MNEIANTTAQQLPAKIEQLAAEARMYATNIQMNFYHLGRVLSEAKKMVPHGAWNEWVQENAGCNMRTAQQVIQSYERFGDMPQFMALDKTKLYKLTALPEGTETAFIAENDVADMTTRQVEQAVKEFKAKMQGEIDRERAARAAAEKRAEEAAAASRADARDLETINRLTRENAALKRDAQETQDMLADQQAEIERVQGKLLDLQAQQARGDTERSGMDEMTEDAFAASVRQFIGTCARVPYMGRAFAGMETRRRSEYEELVSAVEGWCRGAREALNNVAEGVLAGE